MKSPAIALLFPIGMALVLCMSSGSRAQQQSAASDGRQATTLRASAQLVLVDASIELKKNGERLGGLTAADFLLTEDGVPQTITSLSVDQIPLSLMFLFDLTDTVHPVLIHLSNGAAEVLRHLRPEDEVAVMTFSSRAELVQGFTRDRMSALEGIDSASASYNKREPTFIFEDVWEATLQAERSRAKDSRKVQIWLTDGTANDQDTQQYLARNAPTTLHTEPQATDALLRSGVVVSALLERSSAPTPEAHFGDIERYAELTGGPVLYATTNDVAARLAALLDTLRERYTLGYRPGEAKPDGTVCHLKLELSPAFFAAHPHLRAKDLAVRSRQSYVRVAPVR